jgi:hypothetical protein
VLAAFPSLKPKDVQAAIAFAAASAEEDLPVAAVLTSIPDIRCSLSSTRTCLFK